jgi:hypothetical protein
MIAEPFLLVIFARHLPHYKLNSAVVSLLPVEMLYGRTFLFFSIFVKCRLLRVIEHVNKEDIGSIYDTRKQIVAFLQAFQLAPQDRLNDDAPVSC